MIQVDFAQAAGVLKPLHGVNNGPISFGSMLDNRHRFRELGVPWVRLHDTNWPHPREVDVPQIFPDFNADPEEPASYCFGPTDDYLRSILDTGAQIIFRLGTSIEHYARKRYIFTPPDPAKWARICLGIVRHYSEGWANGIPKAVEYWEIWNEPDLGEKMWSGRFEDYLELYRVTATTLKAHDPKLRVGGPAACMYDRPSYAQFIAYCAQHTLPLDFYSWHLYAPRPEDLVKRAVDIRQLLDAHGFHDTPCFLTEWNFLPAPWEILCSQDEYLRRASFERLKSEEGAAFCASTLIKMQDAPVDIMNYYDAQAMTWFCGLFDYYGVPQKTFHAFKAFKEMLAYPQRVVASCDIPGVDVLAARSADGRASALLIANFGAHEGKISIGFAGLAGAAAPVIRLLDRDHNLEPLSAVATGANAFVVGQGHLSREQVAGESGAGRLELLLRRHAVVLVQLGGELSMQGRA
jgi:xylan 1,4-beta-xylosidase